MCGEDYWTAAVACSGFVFFECGKGAALLCPREALGGEARDFTAAITFLEFRK